MVHSWTEAELITIGGAEESQISSHGRDGTARPYITIGPCREPTVRSLGLRMPLTQN
ncbi:MULTISPECIES: hypothetical protein [Rhodococcus]|uniref:hypothetical protein n=1 Tax=Rhodococcus TaxID=1827 RepID=UPI001F3E7DF8|nr:hypothetical protein [Rhodococcus erythropolis]